MFLIAASYGKAMTVRSSRSLSTFAATMRCMEGLSGSAQRLNSSTCISVPEVRVTNWVRLRYSGMRSGPSPKVAAPSWSVEPTPPAVDRA